MQLLFYLWFNLDWSTWNVDTLLVRTWWCWIPTHVCLLLMQHTQQKERGGYVSNVTRMSWCYTKNLTMKVSYILPQMLSDSFGSLSNVVELTTPSNQPECLGLCLDTWLLKDRWFITCIVHLNLGRVLERLGSWCSFFLSQCNFLNQRKTQQWPQYSFRCLQLRTLCKIITSFSPPLFLQNKVLCCHN